MLASRCLSPVAWLSHALSRAEEPSTRSVIAARGGPGSSTLMSLPQLSQSHQMTLMQRD